MNAITFSQLSRQGCLDSFPVVTRNAQRHHQAALILSSIGDYGNAISHLILGAEELLKASVLFLDGKGFNLRNKSGVNKIFYNHKARHAVAKEFFSVWLFVRKMILPDSYIGNSRRKILRQGISLFYGAIFGLQNYEWWDNADCLKQKGFYVDFADNIVNPASFTDNEYNQALRYFNALRKDFDILIDSLGKLNQHEIDEVIELFSATELAELIDESIKR